MSAQSIFEGLMNEKCIKICEVSGGVTNKNYSIITKKCHYILRLPGKGTNEYINRHWEIENLKKLSALKLSPEILYYNVETGIIISKYLENNIPMSKNDISNPKRITLICDCLSKLHSSSIYFTNEFDLEKTKEHYLSILKKMNVSLPSELLCYNNNLNNAMQSLFKIYPKELVPCHGDPKLNNFLLKDNKIWMIDLEYSGMADRYFDLVNMAMTNNLNSEEEKHFLEVYEKISAHSIDYKKYILYKIATDYMWIFWHLIKLSQNELVEYNENTWHIRLYRALKNLEILEG